MFKVEPLQSLMAGSAGTAPVHPAQLPVGSVFAVEAVRDSTSQQLLLLLAGRRWVLKPGEAAAGLEAGSRVQVRVVRNEPDIELALVGRTNEVSAALRRELPQQASPLRLVANLEWLARQAPEAASRLPAPVRTALDAAWRSIPAREHLMQAASLERACLDSGVRLESRLAAGTPRELTAGLPLDWKAVLCKLQDTLVRAGGAGPGTSSHRTEIPVPTRHGPLTAVGAEAASLARMDDVRSMLGELTQHVREALARVACTQLASLDRNEQAALPLLLEIPYREPAGAGLLRLRIGRETPDARAPAASPVWSIEFALDLGAHGPLRGRVTLAEGRVSVTLQPEFALLAQAIDTHVETLRDTLQDAGVPVGKLTCVRADPVDDGPTGAWLVNLRA